MSPGRPPCMVKVAPQHRYWSVREQAMRVVLADNQADVRSALRLLVTHVLDLRVVGEVTAAADLWTQVQDAGPDLLLLDWGLLGAGADAALARLHAVYPDLQVIVL